jgi:DNA-binding IclR family transcriptional regulator
MTLMSTNDAKPWTFVTSHTQVLLCLARDPDARMRDVADTVGITERAAQRIVADLVEAGYVERQRVGRRNRYTINTSAHMRHRSQLGHEIGDLLQLLQQAPNAHRDDSSKGPQNTPKRPRRATPS